MEYYYHELFYDCKNSVLLLLFKQWFVWIAVNNTYCDFELEDNEEIHTRQIENRTGPANNHTTGAENSIKQVTNFTELKENFAELNKEDSQPDKINHEAVVIIISVLSFSLSVTLLVFMLFLYRQCDRNKGLSIWNFICFLCYNKELQSIISQKYVTWFFYQYKILIIKKCNRFDCFEFKLGH